MTKNNDEVAHVDRLQAVPLYHQLFLQLREEIINGSRAFGSRLPPEQELAETFGVSRITARRALAELADANLVGRKRRVGTHVTYQSPVRPIEGSIEQAMESLITYGRKTQVRILDLDTVPAKMPVTEALGIAAGTPVLRVARVRLLENQPISHLVSYVPAELAGGMDRSSLRSTPMLTLLEQAGVQIGAATQIITASLADASLANLLEVEIGSPILRVSRTVSDTNRRPVQHVVAQFRPDLYQIKLDLHSAVA
ncbi:GntR family transcriptional regulator [Sphingomonas sp. 179-I 2A4 NHS]|jgi:GntR family transcriptional regulator|uniref:GntR family transcriptional regulator n=1 Tax=unclassified Sphingomonas TaxID=196159 RepID=UPI0038793F9E